MRRDHLRRPLLARQFPRTPLFRNRRALAAPPSAGARWRRRAAPSRRSSLALVAGVAVAALAQPLPGLAEPQADPVASGYEAATAQSPADPGPAWSSPWSGLTIVVTPLPTTPPSPYEQAISESEDAENADIPTAGTNLSEPPPRGTLVASPLDAPRPSVWSTLGSSSVPSLPEGAPNPYSKLADRKAKPIPQAALLPTRMELKEGGASFIVSTSASGSAPVSSALSPSEGGSSGEVKGRVGYQHDNLTLYGTGAVGASASTSTPSLYDSMAVGSTLSVPLSPLGLDGEKLGARVEMNDTAAVTTGLELRGGVGTTQRFISIQRTASPDADPSGLVRAGVLGKF